MICKCGSYVSGDFCTICERVIRDKPKLKTKIAKRAESKKIDDEVYKAKRLKFLRVNQRCEVFPELKAVEIHHKAGRLGKNYLDESTWMAVSRAGHNWIHDNDAEARAKGFLLTRTN